MTALRENIRDLEGDVKAYGDYKHVPANQQSNVRNDMYVASETSASWPSPRIPTSRPMNPRP